MTADEIAAFLDEPRTLNVATVAPDGAIHLVAMWFVMHGECPAFWTYAKSQKVRNLRHDPRLSALVEGGDSYGTLRGVELIGAGRIVDEPVEVLELGRELAQKYDGRSPDDHDLGRAAAKRVGVVLEPARTISWDHSKLVATPRLVP
jgi:PPOX class probable F420-dependent enzyme